MVMTLMKATSRNAFYSLGLQIEVLMILGGEDSKLCLSAQDHVRAAMTCIRFFTHRASSYLQLGEKQVSVIFSSTVMQ